VNIVLLTVWNIGRTVTVGAASELI